MAVYNTYTPEEIEWLKENAPLVRRRELTERFNVTFSQSRSVAGIKAFCNKNGFHSGEDGRFKPGHKSWQKGLRGEEFKAHYTPESFARGIEGMRKANKTRRIGDELIIDGEPWIVTSLEYGVPFHERRAPKRRVVWEQLHGEIQKDHCIICLDGNPLNCTPENLYCLPTRFRPLLAKNRWWFGNAELTRTAIRWCELHFAVKDFAKKED